MNFSEGIHVKSNFELIARDRGKIVPGACVKNHNIWVNLGREFLPQVVSPNADFTHHMLDTFIGYMSFGIGGNKQTVNVGAAYPDLEAAYPGQLLYDKGTPGTKYLERPVMTTGTPGPSGSGDWAVRVLAPPTLVQNGSLYSTVEFTGVVSDQAINLGGTYPSVPVSEAGLMLYNQPVMGAASTDIFNYTAPPAYINPARPTVVAYNNFGPITKTTDITLEVRWKLQF
jgi:hypothetical protein